MKPTQTHIPWQRFKWFLLVLIALLLVFSLTGEVRGEEDALAGSIGTTVDTDQDGLPDGLEQDYQTSPAVFDTDHDGYGDGEEVYDLGTDPTKETKAFFSDVELYQKKYLKIFSLPDKSKIIGKSVFLKGLYYKPNDEVSVSLTDYAGATKQVKLATDARGVFHQVVGLSEFCTKGADKRVLSLYYNFNQTLQFRLDCADPHYDELLSNVFLGDHLISLSHIPEALSFATSGDVVVHGVLQNYTALKAYFSSIVLTSGLLADASEEKVILRPYKNLEKGSHSLVLSLQNPSKHILYAPVEIPFNVERDPGIGSLLKAELFFDSSAYALPFVIASGGVIMIRFMKRREKQKKRRK